MKTSEANIEDLKGMVVSDGTMRSEDLIPKFLNVLKVYGRDVYDKYVGENPEVLDLSGMDDETMGWVVDELFDKLNEIAPEGYSFGSQDGDGACYGFWSVDVDERKKCEAYIQPVTLYSTTRYDDAEAVQSFLRDIGGDNVTVDKQRNGDVLSVNVSGSDDDVEAFVDTYKNEYGSIVKDCEVDVTGWTAPEDIYYIATEQGRKELQGESKKSEGSIRDTKCVQCGSSPAMFKLDGCSGNFCLSCAKEFHWVCPEHLKDKVSHKKSEADATFKVGDFVSYEAGADGKDPYGAYVYCEVIGINDDGTLDLCPFGTYADTAGIGDNANPAYCEKLDHFAGMVDANHYYMDGKYNAYKGGWEILITDKELNPKVYEFIGTIDDLSEVVDIDDYYGGETFVFDEDLKDEVANNTGWDVETTTFTDMTGDVGESKPAESKKSESKHGLIMATMNNGERKASVAKESEIASVEKEYKAASHKFAEVLPVVYFDDYNAVNTAAQDWVRKGVKPKSESKKSESLTLKQKELKDMARYGEAEDITTISDVEAKELKKNGIETVGISRGAYGMNGALLRDSEGKKYVITARSSNLFYFV